jgi:hypothetical protein
MGRSTRDWNKGLANDLKDATFMRAFINASLDEGVPIQQVLRKCVGRCSEAPWGDVAGEIH